MFHQSINSSIKQIFYKARSIKKVQVKFKKQTTRSNLYLGTVYVVSKANSNNNNNNNALFVQ